MKNLLKKWGQSLEVCIPRNGIPLLKVSLKTVLSIYQSMALFLVSALVLLYIFMPSSLAGAVLSLIFFLILWIFLLTLAARPSVGLKNFWYFESHLLVLIPLSIGVFALLFLPLGAFLFPYFLFFLFFLYDARLSVKDLLRIPLRTFKLSLGMLPLYFILASIWYGIMTYGIMGNHFAIWGVFFAVFIILPFYVAVISRLYIIAIHKEYKEYYEGCW